MSEHSNSFIAKLQSINVGDTMESVEKVLGYQYTYDEDEKKMTWQCPVNDSSMVYVVLGEDGKVYRTGP